MTNMFKTCYALFMVPGYVGRSNWGKGNGLGDVRPGDSGFNIGNHTHVTLVDHYSFLLYMTYHDALHFTTRQTGSIERLLAFSGKHPATV